MNRVWLVVKTLIFSSNDFCLLTPRQLPRNWTLCQRAGKKILTGFFSPRKLFHTRAQRSIWVWKWKFSWIFVYRGGMSTCMWETKEMWQLQFECKWMNVENISEDVFYGVYAFRAFIKVFFVGEMFGICFYLFTADTKEFER